MIRAENYLTDLINSVEEGTVKVATLKLLEKHLNQFLKLDEICQKHRKVATSIKDSFSRRISEMEAFLAWIDHLKCFTNFSNIFATGKYIVILCPKLFK